MLFMAVTVKVYALSFSKPVTVMGLAAPVTVIVPVESVTSYSVMGLPPSSAGAVKVSVTWPLPAVAVIVPGAPGTVAGVTSTSLDAALKPPGFPAFTIK
ncbi:hypothetical protein D3C75_1220730 [compost metagenome]